MSMKTKILSGLILLGMTAFGWCQTVPTPGRNLTQVPGLNGLPQTGNNVGTSVTPNTVMQPMRPTQNVSKPLPPLNPYPQPTLQAPTGRVQYGQHNPSASTQKPFADYQKPATFSPYMNLYRRDNFSGIDNYNLYVKPALEAEQQNAQTQREIMDLRQQQQQQQSATQSTRSQGVVYGRLNSGVGASYGFSGSSGLRQTAPPAEQAPQEEEDEEDEEEKKEERGNLYINPYNPYLPPGVGQQKVRTIP